MIREDPHLLGARVIALERENRLLKEAVSQGGHIRSQSNRVLDSTLERLELQNIRFEAALDNMTQGLCMLDATHRIAVLNRRFATMFGIADRNALTNAPPRELLDATLKAGTLTDPTGEELFMFPQAVEVSTIASFTRELADGRMVTVNRQPVAGGGWVVTYEDVTERHRAEAQLDHMALHDSLTDLPNRALFRMHLERELALIGRGDRFALLFLDLDRFKTVNDTLGHQIGDALLRAVAGRLKECVREGDVIARLGGDEFAIIQSSVEQPISATALARRLVDIIGEPFDLDEHQVVVGLSIGIVLAPADGLTANDILKNADLALYRAKAEGRGTYRFFAPIMNAQMQERRHLELDLRHAVANRQLELFYQPLINMASGRVCSFEALLRWHHPSRGLVQPGDFIPLAEEVGLIIPIGEWVLDEACHEAVKWPREIRLAVNVSVAQFRSPHLVEATAQALRSSGLAPDRLDIEITESVLMQDTEVTLATLGRLRDLGARISMDDFGTGYSSLSYLRSFPFHKIKIDQCFVHDLSTSGGSIAIIRAIVRLGHALGMSVTAEGVETEQQLAQLRAEGCTEGQGYLFSRACSADRVPDMIASLNDTAARPFSSSETELFV
ncbi:MAG TPA: EAL domain-containing protein [Acetobacteraceae bacterium]|jgi:diguanylate cyclase (GGDEF)-like protein